MLLAVLSIMFIFCVGIFGIVHMRKYFSGREYALYVLTVFVVAALHILVVGAVIE